MRTGIMGGTFNPPHLGHLHAAECVKEALGLDKVLFIPTNLPPHKKMPAGSANTRQRCEMVELMLEGHDWAELNTIEIDRGGASYTIDTLRALHETGKYGELFLIMGTDMLMMLDYGWRNPEEICRICTLAVVARGAGQQEGLQEKAAMLREKYHADIQLVDSPVVEISSTQLRAGQALREMVPPTVFEFIEQNRLYTFEKD
ncbi:MAG: nicotinate-nucleotide adenylyltransferase [Butyricicoccus sp.]